MKILREKGGLRNEDVTDTLSSCHLYDLSTQTVPENLAFVLRK